MAVHVLAHLAIKNLKNRVWEEEDVEHWLQDMSDILQQSVTDKINDVLTTQHEYLTACLRLQRLETKYLT